MRTICKFSAFCLAFLVCAAAVRGQNDAKPVVSTDPLTSEQLAVYGAVVSAWTDKDTTPGNLANRTSLLVIARPSDDAVCAKGLDLEPQSPNLIHQIQSGDLVLLGVPKYKLVDPERDAQEVRDNDPEKSMRRGDSVDHAVRNGFAHGLLTLSEIRFDKTHTHAIVAFSFVCGSLCGHGMTLILEKTDSGWRKSGACDIWMSQTAPASRGAASVTAC
jgi:hypothetical protein